MKSVDNSKRPAASTLSSSNAYIPADLSRLTVPQLKALCKERKFTGYSKLGKQALVQKLLESGACVNTGAGADATARGSVDAPAAGLGPPPATVNVPLSAVDLLRPARTTNAGAGISLSSLGSRAVSSATNPNARARNPKAVQSNSESRKPSVAVEDSSSSQQCSQDAFRNVHSPPIMGTIGSISSSLQDLQATRGLADDRLSTAPPLVLHAKASSPSRTKEAGTLKRPARRIANAMPPPPPKKPRILQPIPTSNLAVAPSQLISAPAHAASAAGLPATNINQANSSAVSTLVPPKRFKPLVVDRSKLLSVAQSTRVQPGAPCDTSAPPVTAFAFSLASLEEFVAPVPALFHISMPPTLAQRKRVKSWAIILSGLSNKERSVCVLVSHAFRYAVYLSASCILERDFGGKRLQEDVLRKYPKAMTNMWPYLQTQESEVVHRRRIYKASFLARFLRQKGLQEPIAKHLWASPDNPKQLAVAVKFALTRMWFELSVGSSEGSWLHDTVVDVQEIVRGEIWSVSVASLPGTERLSRSETLYVLEATCEVIGRPASSRARAEVSRFPVRADWSMYISSRLSPSSTEATSLLSHLKWACQEEYDRGISTLWLKRIADEGPAGIAKRVVAERYVLSCVVGNSISGQWMTTNEMAQEFAGLPERVAAGKQKSPTLNLYLPEHHHVESVHFTSARGSCLHPALAVVQTPHREYFILRDNGMQVGCEEEGVAHAWQEVLQCDHSGLEVNIHV